MNMPPGFSQFLKVSFPWLLVFGLLRLVFWFATFPNPDEAYYWLWGQHPALSYYDHPPLQAWVQGAFTAVLGRSTVSLRLPNLFSNGLLFYTYFQILIFLYGEKGRSRFWLLLCLLLASPLYFLFLALAWHDHLLIALSLFGAYQFIRFLDQHVTGEKGEDWRLYLAAVAIGLAGLCKYNAIFVSLGCVAALVVDDRCRPLLRDRRIYLAGAIVLSFLLPILLWNWSNDFQSFRYYLNRSANSGSFIRQSGSFFNFALFSILMLSPIHFYALFKLLKRPKLFLQTHSVYGTVALGVFAVSTIALTLLSFVSTALYYWNITAYLLLFPLIVSVFIREDGDGRRAAPDSSITTGSSPGVKSRLFLGSQIYGLLFATLLVIHYSFFPLSALADRSGDPDSRMLFGWTEVAGVVATEATGMGGNPLLLTTDYRSASALAYQLNNPAVLAISDRLDQFDFWYERDRPLGGKDALILSDDWHPLTPDLAARFDHLSDPIVIPVIRFGIWIKNYYLLRGTHFRDTELLSQRKAVSNGHAEHKTAAL